MFCCRTFTPALFSIVDAKIELNQKRIEMEQEMKAEKQKMFKEIEEWRTNEAQTLKKEIQKEKSQLETERKKLEEERNEFEKRKNVFGQHLKETDPVDINVRGKMMTVGYGTLTKKNSLLSKMFTGEHPIHQGKDGRYFIDCDPSYFTILLNWLVYGEVDDEEMNHLKKVVKLFQFEPIEAQKQVVTQSQFNHSCNEREKGVPLFFNSLDLSGLNLSGVDLSNSSFVGCNLSKCKFMNTNLTQAKLHGADLTDITATASNFDGATLIEANISQSKFDGCNFLSADLSNVNMRDSIFDRCNFTSANLSNVDVGAMNLKSCVLSNVNLTREQLLSLIGSIVLLQGPNLSNKDLSKIDFSGVTLSECNLTNADLTGCLLKNTMFNNCIMNGAKLDDCDLISTVVNSNLSQVKLTIQQVVAVARKENSVILDLKNMDFSNRDLSGLKFAGSNCSGAKFINTKLRGTDMSHCDLTNCDLTGAKIENALFTGANTLGCTGCTIPNHFVSCQQRGCTLSKNNKRFKKVSYTSSYVSVFGSTLVNQFSIRLLTDVDGLKIGVATMNYRDPVFKYDNDDDGGYYSYDDPRNFPFNPRVGCFFDCNSGQLYSLRNYAGYSDVTARAKGTLITVLLKNDELSFVLDGRKLGGYPLQLKPGDRLFPCVTHIHGPGEFEILP